MLKRDVSRKGEMNRNDEERLGGMDTLLLFCEGEEGFG